MDQVLADDDTDCVPTQVLGVAWGEFEPERRASTQYIKLEYVLSGRIREHGMQLLPRVHHLAIHSHDDVSGLESSGIGRRTAEVFVAEGARVVITLSARIATTDAGGWYLVENVSPGTGSLEVRARGYLATWRNVTVTAGRTTDVADVPMRDLRRGVCQTPGGTSLAPVARHLRANRVRRAVS